MSGSWYGLGQPYGHGRSYQEPFRGVNPAAGVSFSLALSGKFRHRIKSCVFTLTTDANVANRYVTLEYEGDDGNPIWINAAAVVVTASSTQRFVGSSDRTVSEWAANTDVLFPIDKMFLDAGTLKINVAGVQAGDALTLIRFVWDKFPTQDDVMPSYGSEAK